MRVSLVNTPETVRLFRLNAVLCTEASSRTPCLVWSHPGSGLVLASLQPPCLKGGRLRPANLIPCLPRNLQGYFIPSKMRWVVVFVRTQGLFPYYRFWSDHAGKRGQGRNAEDPLFAREHGVVAPAWQVFLPLSVGFFLIGTIALGFAWRISQTCRGRSGHR